MTKLALGIEYNGSHYQGWQAQQGLPTVQAELEQALSQVANQTIITHCAGRTDAGVHGLGQVVHFETQATRSADNWLRGTNTYLPDDISVRWVKFIDDDFHARFSANARSYQYIIYNHNVRPAILANQVTWYNMTTLDEQRMHDAAQHLLGEHDFTSFRAAGCQSKSSQRLVKAISVERKQHYIIISITANAFLYHMVRNIVGVLVEIGAEQQATDWTTQLLNAKDRTQAGITMPAAGLYFHSVEYPAHYDINSSSPLPSVLLV